MDQKTRRDEFSGGFPEGLRDSFQDLKDPRNGRHPQHYFGEVIYIALAAMICNCEGFADFERFANLKKNWLKKHLKLPNGVPSNDTFARIFTRIDADVFCRNCPAGRDDRGTLTQLDFYRKRLELQ